ncbi:MAG: serine/threonine-protein kinase [Polyangiales bacterium]
MAERFVRCQLCGIPHPADVRECPIHRKPIVAAAKVDARPSAPPSSPPPLPASRPTAAPTPASLIGRLLSGRYKVTGVIAAGGMGVVYDGLQVALGRRVAIKCLHPRFATDTVAIARFQNEAMVSGSFGHPHIVEVFDLGWLDDARAPYLVMERLDGETLGARIQRERKLPIPLVVAVARQTLSALAATHARGILHRDLKPDNLFLMRAADGVARVKVLDFGLSKAMAPVEDAARLTRSGVVMGTPSYMAPEQAMGAPDLDARVDLYALGMILYEALLGRPLYTARTPAALMQEIGRVRPPTPRLVRPEVPTALDAAVMKAIARDRTKRFSDAAEMQRALAALPADDADAPEADPTVVSAPPSEMPRVIDPDTTPVRLFARKP